MDELEFDSNLSVKAVYDYNLIRAALDKGDQKAYAELMGRYRDSVYFMILKMVNNKDDADDLTIEAFGKAFKRLGQYTPTFAFSTWLFKIASNNCIDFIRRKKMTLFSIDKKFETNEGNEMNMDLKADGLNPEEDMVRKQQIKQMRAIVEKLKPRYRALIESRYFDELSYDEIADKLELPIGTVKAQLYRAREFLTIIWKKENGIANEVSEVLIAKYFDNLTETQQQQFAALQNLYEHWNMQINVISRKDIDLLYERHVLHSLGIAKVMNFQPQTTIMDVGCGGGFPGIPLAILFPECNFYLIDSIAKKIKVVNEVATALGLKNVRAEHKRAEEVEEKFEFVVSRAVTESSVFYQWVQNKISDKQFNSLPNGIFFLKGGDLSEEFQEFKEHAVFYELKDYFTEEFFETKKVVYLPMLSE